ncbi:hypothetical protein Acr_00g0027740 [Actinidia rufa]|uniref:Uncharacterized protein n=1 Tax=Actinidia rufa TaxID=165716 RepID=A0A7J0DE62_9ERIC|nr:hypothetical protein Acr_00g0027740 [Actinidia rufa]
MGEPKKEQRKELKSSWEPRQMSVEPVLLPREVSARRDREIAHRDQLGSSHLGYQFQLRRQIRVTQAGSPRARLFVIGAINQVTFARSAHKEYVIIVDSKVTFLQIVRKGKNTHSGVGSVQQQSSGQTSNYQQRHQQQRNQSQQSRQSVASERGSRMERGDASTTSKQFSRQRGGHVQSQGVQGRVYAITDATTIPSQTEPSVVRGIFLLFSSWARVLIDSGASHSFLSSSFAYALELKVDVLRPSLFVESPVGGRVSLDRICRKCELVISDRRLLQKESSGVHFGRGVVLILLERKVTPWSLH